MLEILYLAAILVAVLYLFWSQRLRTDVTAVLVLLALIVPWPHGDGAWSAVLTPEEGFSGFGSTAVMMIAGMFVIGGAIVQTGAAEVVGLRLLRRAAGREWTLQLTVLCSATLASMFINDTTVVLIFLPLLRSVCRERDLSPSRYLLFAAYGSLLGGQWTLIGTRSNLVLSDYLRAHAGGGIGFFDFTPLAAPIFVLSALYLILVGRRFLPNRASEFPDPPMKEFLSELRVPEESAVIGQRPREIEVIALHRLTAVALIRGEERQPLRTRLRAGDLLIVRGTADSIGELVKSADLSLRDDGYLDEGALSRIDLVTVEAVLPAHSYYAGQTLGAIPLESLYDVTVLGVAHRGQQLAAPLAEARLGPGDSLLLLGGSEEVERLQRVPALMLLDWRSFPAIAPVKALVMALLLAFVIGCSVSGTLSPAISIPLAAAAALLMGCTSLKTAYESVDWPTLVTLGGMIPFGLALEKTGAAELIATRTVAVFSGYGPAFVLGALLLTAVAFTQLIENAAVAIIVAPIALQVALAAEMDPKPTLVALAVCVSAGFSTPVAHESTLLVMGPGNYDFRHYLLIGGVLALFTWGTTTVLAPLIWGNA